MKELKAYNLVSIVIPTKNSESNVVDTLESVKHFKNIYVVDSNSTDRTVDIAREYGALVIDFSWNGKYPKKRNWFLEKNTLNTEWVLFLDSDELLTEEFITELDSVIAEERYNGYILTYTNHFMGKPLKYGIPAKKLALFRQDAGRYQKIEEDSWSNFDMEVHEHPEIKGEIGQIKSRILHFDFIDINRHLSKHHDYAKFESENYLNRTFANNELTFRQKIKYNLLSSIFFPFLYFFADYILYLGFMNGRRGFLYSCAKFMYFFEIYLLVNCNNERQ